MTSKTRPALTLTLSADDADRILRALDSYGSKHADDFPEEERAARALRVQIAEQRTAVSLSRHAEALHAGDPADFRAEEA